MNCPVDGAELRISDRQGIEVDYCPTCRGVWLDRGELDKIIERQVAAPIDEAPEGYGEEREFDDRRGGSRSKRRRRRSMLEELLDFG